MSEDILDRIHAHFRGVTFYEGRKPTLLEEAAAEIESLRAKLAEAEKDSTKQQVRSAT